MSSTAVALGAQQPRVATVPDHTWSHADDAAFFAAAYGLTPDPWQAIVLRAWLAEQAGGRWAAPQCGLSVARQNGKNAVLEIRELYGMVALGERFLHSAHEVKTTRKAFARLKGFFGRTRNDPSAAYPELNKLVAEVRSTNGQESIRLANGGVVEFAARSSGSGRGFSVDVLVLDEAQHLSEDELEAMLPTVSVAPNPQVIMTGTPPSPVMHGEVFARTRKAGTTGTASDLAWHEWGIPEMVDVTDRNVADLAAATNPALGIRLSLDTVRREQVQMSPAGFARERLGLWPAASVPQVIDPDLWAACATAHPPSGGTPVFAVDMSPDRSMLAVGAALTTAAGVHVEVVRHDPATTGRTVVDWLASRTDTVTVDGQSPAVALTPALQARGLTVRVTGASDMAKACGMLFDAVADATLTHFDQDPLNAAVAGARKRPIGYAGGWGWSRNLPDLDLTPLVAVTLAAYTAATPPPTEDKPKAEIWGV